MKDFHARLKEKKGTDGTGPSSRGKKEKKGKEKGRGELSAEEKTFYMGGAAKADARGRDSRST